MTTTAHSAGTITIRGHQIQTKTFEIEHENLRFFQDNPRIYTLVHADGQDPTQEEIQELLLGRDYVRDLMLDIKANGGLMEPVIVRDGTFEVLEGNSRLAAYRGLSKQDPIAWGRIKCTVIPENTDDSLVFALLGQFHVKGKKAWQPFEQAGFLYRRCKDHKLDYKTLANEIGKKWKEVKHLVETYQFMLDHDEPPERWSYHDEYLKSHKIARARENQPNLDDRVVKMIKLGQIPKAVVIRDELPHICLAPKTLQKFVDGRLDFEDAFDQARSSGTDHVEYRRLVKFREFITDSASEGAFVASEKSLQSKCVYELGKIEASVKALRAKLKVK